MMLLSVTNIQNYSSNIRLLNEYLTIRLFVRALVCRTGVKNVWAYFAVVLTTSARNGILMRG